MTEPTLPDKILVVPMPAESEAPSDYEPQRGGPFAPGGEPLRHYEPQRRVPVASPDGVRAVAVRLSELSAGVKEFLGQMETLLKDAPVAMGEFTLRQLEVSAGVSADGKLTLFGVGGVEAGIEGGLKFVFERRDSSLRPE